MERKKRSDPICASSTWLAQRLNRIMSSRKLHSFLEEAKRVRCVKDPRQRSRGGLDYLSDMKNVHSIARCSNGPRPHMIPSTSASPQQATAWTLYPFDTCRLVDILGLHHGQSDFTYGLRSIDPMFYGVDQRKKYHLLNKMQVKRFIANIHVNYGVELECHKVC
eukprot:scaffold234_cov353-Pavlova_lutheri.AAC.4